MQTEKQVKFFIDEKEREQFKLLCKTKGVSASSVMRYWVQTAVQNQEINVTAPPDGRGYYTPPARETSTIDEEKMTALLKRLNKVERIFNYIIDNQCSISTIIIPVSYTHLTLPTNREV